MRATGAFPAPLSGALHGAHQRLLHGCGGKALVNAYYRSAEKLGVQIRYESPVDRPEIENGQFRAAWCQGERIEAKACATPAASSPTVTHCARPGARTSAANGLPDNFLIRGTAYNQGALLRHMLEQHQADSLGDPTQGPHGGDRRACTAV